MKIEITEKQVHRFDEVYCANYPYGGYPAFKAALQDFAANLPDPIPTLRPIAEMPADVPEGCERKFWGTKDAFDGSFLCSTEERTSEDTHFIDIRLPDPVDRDRVEFEEWASSKGFDISRNNGAYHDPGVDRAWEGWQARKPKA